MASAVWSISKTQVPQVQAQAGAAIFPVALGAASRRRPVGEHDPFRLCAVKVWCFAPGDVEPRSAGSGVFISNDVLLTVAHVLFDRNQYGPDNGGYVGHVQIQSPWFPIPAQAAATRRFVTPPGWTRPNPRRDADIGVIRLNAPVPGITPLIPQAHTDQQLAGVDMAVYGFPALSRQLYTAVGRCVGLESNFVYYDADATEGESGSALLAALPGGPELVGLHRAGTGETPANIPDSVSAFRLTTESIAWVQAMIARL